MGNEKPTAVMGTHVNKGGYYEMVIHEQQGDVMERREWRGVGQALPTVTKTLAGMFIVQVTDQRLVAAFERREDYETAINDHNQHTALVEQRDLLVVVARAVVKKYEGSFAVPFEDAELLDIAMNALATVEQGHEELAGGGRES